MTNTESKTAPAPKGKTAPADFKAQPIENLVPLDSFAFKQQQANRIRQQYPPELVRQLAANHGAPLLVLSTDTIRAQYQRLQHCLPRVKHHFALKPLPHTDVVQTLQQMGAYFDLASSKEVDLMREQGVSPEHCIHTHPIKRPADVQHALEFGIRTFVFDNPWELEKLLPFRPQIRLLLRLAFPNQSAQCDLSSKFGVLPKEALSLLRKAQQMGFEVAGLSFHVGSQMPGPEKHVFAIETCRQIFDQAAQYGIRLKVLDIGGGFPVEYTHEVMSIEDFSKPIQQALDLLFPDTEIFSEPGRFICAPAVTLFCTVIGKSVRNGQWYYYLDDGIYNSYSGILFDHGEYPVFSLRQLEQPELPSMPCTLAGPTCDSIDVMYKNLQMPELNFGDILISPMMGAYAGASHATDFNYIMRPQMVTLEKLRKSA